jgi:subtilase family serine protease
MKRKLMLWCAPIMALTLLLSPISQAPTSARATAGPHPLLGHLHFLPHTARPTTDPPPTLDECVNSFGLTCLGPAEFQKVYNLGPLSRAGLNGRGRTIVIVDAFGSPTVREDLAIFDAAYGIPDPPSFDIIHPAGPSPVFNYLDPQMSGWAAETTLDVQIAHEIAPGARILLVTTPVSETEGVTGFPEMMLSENYVIDHNLGDVISQSFAATEETFPNRAALLGLRSAFKNAVRHKVTVLAGSGDQGPTGGMLDLTCCYSTQVAQWPASDPLVTAVGGTQIQLDAAGNRTAPDSVWNDYGASGGGPSHVFSRPGFQDRVANVVGRHRGIPDISMSAFCWGALAYFGYDPRPDFSGWGFACGTSEAAPLFAGIVAIADQAAGKRLGFLNDRLYNLLGRKHSGLVDVTAGDNTFSFCTACGTPQEVVTTVPGYAAAPGYDMATGLGTIDGTLLVKSLVGEDSSNEQG